MQEEQDTFSEKKKLLIEATSSVVSKLLNESGQSGRKFSAEYEIGLGLISKLKRIQARFLMGLMIFT